MSLLDDLRSARRRRAGARRRRPRAARGRLAPALPRPRARRRPAGLDRRSRRGRRTPAAPHGASIVAARRQHRARRRLGARRERRQVVLSTGAAEPHPQRRRRQPDARRRGRLRAAGACRRRRPRAACCSRSASPPKAAARSAATSRPTPAARRSSATATRASCASASRSSPPKAASGTACRACARTTPATTCATSSIGSEGTLGIITAATLKLHPRPRGDGDGDGDAADARRRDRRLLALAHERLGPGLTGFEVMNTLSLDLVRDPLRRACASRSPPRPGPCSSSTRTAEDEAHADGGARGAARHGDGARPRRRRRVRLAASSRPTRCGTCARSIPLAQAAEGGNVKHDIALPISAIDEFVASTDAALMRAFPGVRLVDFGHLGDGNLHYNVQGPTGDARDFVARFEKDINALVYDAVAARGGSISAEHGIGALKRDELVARKSPVALDMMRAIKNALDPAGVLNPGRVLSATSHAMNARTAGLLGRGLRRDHEVAARRDDRVAERRDELACSSGGCRSAAPGRGRRPARRSLAEISWSYDEKCSTPAGRRSASFIACSHRPQSCSWLPPSGSMRSRVCAARSAGCASGGCGGAQQARAAHRQHGLAEQADAVVRAGRFAPADSGSPMSTPSRSRLTSALLAEMRTSTSGCVGDEARQARDQPEAGEARRRRDHDGLRALAVAERARRAVEPLKRFEASAA